MSHAHPSLKDVAAAARVSFQTAGKALRGTGRVSAPTRRRVLDAAGRLGYVPNGLARSLLAPRTGTIGVIGANLIDTTLGTLVMGVERQAKRDQLAVLVATLDEYGDEIRRCLRTMVGQRVDGVVLCDSVTERRSDVAALLGAMPAVSLFRVQGGGVAEVLIDDRGAGALPVRHLLALGHERIATITGEAHRAAATLRVAGYREALVEAGVAYRAALVRGGAWTTEGAYQATLALLDGAEPFTAVVAQSDMMALGVLAALHERGVRVPGECSVVGCDNLEFTSRTIPPLTTVALPFLEAGGRAVSELERQLEGAPVPATQLIPPTLVYRSSSAPISR